MQNRTTKFQVVTAKWVVSMFGLCILGQFYVNTHPVRSFELAPSCVQKVDGIDVPTQC